MPSARTEESPSLVHTTWPTNQRNRRLYLKSCPNRCVNRVFRHPARRSACRTMAASPQCDFHSFFFLALSASFNNRRSASLVVVCSSSATSLSCPSSSFLSRTVIENWCPVTGRPSRFLIHDRNVSEAVTAFQPCTRPPLLATENGKKGASIGGLRHRGYQMLNNPEGPNRPSGWRRCQVII